MPRAARTQIVGVHDDRLKIQLNAPPVDGKANKALVAFLAKRFGLKKGSVEIVAGESSRRKRVRVHGLDAEAVERLLSLG